MKMPTENLLTVREAAEKLGVKIAMVNRYCKTGRLPATKLGHQYVIESKDLKEFAKIDRRVGRPKSE
jgi:excisionase family DNA binding protein